jgi:hypothetical protein
MIATPFTVAVQSWRSPITREQRWQPSHLIERRDDPKLSANGQINLGFLRRITCMVATPTEIHRFTKETSKPAEMSPRGREKGHRDDKL